MAKTKQQNLQAIKSKKHKRDQSHLHFAMTAKNFYIIGAGIFLIILGYILMNENSVSGFLPTTIAPLLLIAGYCVVIPVGILYKGKELTTEETVTETLKPESKSNVTSSSTSNVKTA